jgi:hypothetical protein
MVNSGPFSVGPGIGARLHRNEPRRNEGVGEAFLRTG